MKNLRELFTQYPFGFDNFGAWIEHHKALHEKHPLDCHEFGAEWLRRWETVGRLLEAAANVQEYPGGCCFFGPPLRFKRLYQALLDMSARVTAPNQKRVHVTLLDGTVVREWGAQ